MRFIYALVLGVLVGGCGPGPVIEHREPIPRPAVLGLATAVVQHAPRLANVWPDFWTTDQAFAISDSQSTIVYKPHGPGPPGYSAVSGQTGYWVLGGVSPTLARFALDLRYDVGGTTVTAVRIDTLRAEPLDFLFHEAFHVYQGTQFGASRPFVWTHGLPDTVPGVGPQERELLRCATMATDSDDVRSYALEYVRRRLARMATEQDSIVQAEHRVERKEGSAQWVGMKMQGVILGRTEPMMRQAVADLFEWEVPAGSFQMVADGLPFSRRQSLYATGTAIIAVVSRLTEGSWQQEIARGASPFQLLVQALGEAEVLGGAIGSGAREASRVVKWARCTENGV